MKIKQALTTAILTLTATYALAFDPPYHIDSASVNPPFASTGTLKLKFKGGCKMSQTFVGAQYGMIQDSTNAEVGGGFITATGDQVIALYNGSVASAGIIATKQNAATTKMDTVGFIGNLAGPDLVNFLTSGFGCSIAILTNTPNSIVKVTTVGPAVTKTRWKIGFAGYTPYNQSCVVKGSTTTCKSKKITGSLVYTPATFF